MPHPFFFFPPPFPRSSCESRCAAFPWFLVTPAGYEPRRAKIYEGRAQSASQSATNGDSFKRDSLSISKSLGFHGAAPGGIVLPLSPPFFLHLEAWWEGRRGEVRASAMYMSGSGSGVIYKRSFFPSLPARRQHAPPSL